MNDQDLVRRLRRSKRTVDMLGTDLQREHLNGKLLADIDDQMENGITSDPRCSGLRERVDALRESTLTPRPELFRDTIRLCEKLKDAMEEVVNRIR